MRKKLIENKLTEIIESINSVAENLPTDFEEFKHLGLVKDGIYKKTEFAIENLLDICSIINSDLRLGIPEVEDNIIDNLEDKKIFDEKVINLIREIKKFRNILVHKYGKINDEQAFETIKEGLKDFSFIVKEVEKFLKKYKANL